MPRPFQPVCPSGHIKAETGVYSRGRCKLCAHESTQKRRKARRSDALCGALPREGENSACVLWALHQGLHKGTVGPFQKIVWGSSARSKLFSTSLFNKRLAAVPRFENQSVAEAVKDTQDKVSETAPEIWKFLPGSEDHHEISNFGRVKSWYAKGDVKIRLETPRLVQGIVCQRVKYFKVTVRLNGKSCSKKIGQLVALAFIGPLPQGLVLRHLNDDGFDDRLENLAYGTQLENVRDSIRNGTIARGEKRGRAKLTVATVREIRKSLESSRVLGKRYGVDNKTINGIVNRKTWRHV